MDLHNVIISPIVTEKTQEIGSPGADVRRLTFKVHPDANKELIRQALHKLFGVKATKINTMVTMGKYRRFRHDRIRLPKVKKAIVTLERGQNLDVMQAANP